MYCIKCSFLMNFSIPFSRKIPQFARRKIMDHLSSVILCSDFLEACPPSPLRRVSQVAYDRVFSKPVTQSGQRLMSGGYGDLLQGCASWHLVRILLKGQQHYCSIAGVFPLPPPSPHPSLSRGLTHHIARDWQLLTVLYCTAVSILYKNMVCV